MKIKKVLRGALAAIAMMLGGAATPVFAVDGVAVEAGRATNTDMRRASLQWRWSQRWLQGDHWHVGGYWDIGVAQWDREATPGQRSRLNEMGLTPVFRVQGNDLHGLYLEGGIGAHLLSATDLGGKPFSTSFQFGEHLGSGYRFGARGDMEIGYRYQHLSNAGIKRPNSGIEFHQIRLQYWFH